MASQVLPTLTDGTQFYTQRVVLDGVAFVLQFSWNARDSSWYVLILDSSANPLLSRRLAVGSPLLGRFKIQGLPAGEIMAMDTSGQDLDAGLTDLGGRVQLLYIPVADLQ